MKNQCSHIIANVFRDILHDIEKAKILTLSQKEHLIKLFYLKSFSHIAHPCDLDCLDLLKKYNLAKTIKYRNHYFNWNWV